MSTEFAVCYVAYQKPVKIGFAGEGNGPVIPRTFEDALILENLTVVENVEGSVTSAKIRAIVAQGLSGDDLEDELFDLLKTAEKAAFALDCLILEEAPSSKSAGAVSIAAIGRTGWPNCAAIPIGETKQR